MVGKVGHELRSRRVLGSVLSAASTCDIGAAYRLFHVSVFSHTKGRLHSLSQMDVVKLK